jgi:recombinational DNA repair ATPase RecF
VEISLSGLRILIIDAGDFRNVMNTILRLDQIELENYRCFRDLAVNFHERVTVLVAPNGGDKTAVLDAVAIAIGSFVGAFS